MLIDVSIFIVIYFVCLVACTMLFVGIASPEILKPTCGSDDLKVLPDHPDAPMMNMECRVFIYFCEKECDERVTIVL